MWPVVGGPGPDLFFGVSLLLGHGRGRGGPHMTPEEMLLCTRPKDRVWGSRPSPDLQASDPVVGRKLRPCHP